MLRLVQLFAACGFLTAASEVSDTAKTGSDDVEYQHAMLHENDECAFGASGNSCALNALQHKGVLTEGDPDGTETPGMLTCDPVCKTPEVSEDDLAEPKEPKKSADGEEELGASMGSSYIRHYARDCWKHCGGAGWCPNYCGDGNACCRWGFRGRDPAECSTVHFWPILHTHTCVHSHSHHDTATTPAPSTPVSTASSADGTNIQTMYQMTSPENAKSILGSKIHAGHVGWCGGAIYLMSQPFLARSKWDPKTTTSGAWLEIQVDMGKMCRMSRPPNCNDGATGWCCKGPGQENHYGTKGATAAGCNSIIFNPGDGDEWNIWDSSLIKSKKLHSCTGPECAKLFPDFTR
eukprot:TRINITY_DN15268_c0_g1_i2.p1 TRINITY_DN15268_c0_g1~~TRINITY_DN15268_c0_g1_i2.p1  ORF type:complete len:381 (+),score=65.13 TRINITY_DN15268_c0_g1_i2:98-1144(+)